MAGATVTVSFPSGTIAAGFRALAKLGHEPAPLLTAIGAGLVETTQRRFETATDPAGRGWPGWSPAYAAVTTSRGLLRGSLTLMHSVTFAVGARDVRVGSNLVYAAIHQFGGVIRPKNKRALAFRLGDRLVLAKKVTIPARPYLGFGAADRAVVHQVVREALAAALAQRREG